MSKPSHTPLLRQTVDNPQETELLGRKRGKRLVWREKRDSTHAEQVGGWGCSVLGHYGRNHTPVHATWGWGPWYNYRETDNPVTLSTPRETETKTKNQRGWGGNGTETREHQFCRRGNETWRSECLDKRQFMALVMKLLVSFYSLQEENEMGKKSVEPGLSWYFCHLLRRVPRSLKVFPGVSWTRGLLDPCGSGSEIQRNWELGHLIRTEDKGLQSAPK